MFVHSETRSPVVATSGTEPSRTLRSLLAETTTFLRIAELVTTRGLLAESNAARVVALADSFGPGDWRIFAREIQFPQPDQFYFFESDPTSGLNSTEINRAYLSSLTAEARGALRSRLPLIYKFGRVVHDRVFEREAAGFAAGREIYSRIDASPTAKHWAHMAERAIKAPMYDCHDCGDCSLPESAYLCPESQCAKNQRNGPCGGSYQGICEAREKECLWAHAYERLKAYGEEDSMLDRPVVFRDGHLRGTSAWANAFLGRDHRRLSPPPQPRLRIDSG